MARPNYNFQKAERERAKHRKKQEKLKRQEEETAKRQAEHVGDVDPDGHAPSDAGKSNSRQQAFALVPVRQARNASVRPASTVRQ